MKNLAILVGNSLYDNLTQLDCCLSDVEAMKELLSATGKYDNIVIIENENADELKSYIREETVAEKEVGELFYYFTGHGSVIDGEFYHCAKNYDKKKPNESGLSTNRAAYISPLG